MKFFAKRLCLGTNSAAIYANRHYLEIYRRSHPERLAKGRPMPSPRSRLASGDQPLTSALGGESETQPIIIGDVFVHPTASVHPTAVVSCASLRSWPSVRCSDRPFSFQLGPNVTIGRHVTVGAGARVRESIILQGAVLRVRSLKV